MRTVVHLSDLHFGRTDDTLLDPLVSTIRALAPDVIAVSGDLTQRARRAQFQAARAFLDLLPTPKIIVTHHPFDLPAGFESSERVGRAKIAMDMLFSCKCDLLLAGHLHVSEADITPMRFVDREHGVIIVQAGTATSTRARGETNSFNAIAIERQRIEVRRHAWVPTAGAFQHTSSETFARTATGWRQGGLEEHSQSRAWPTRR